MYFIEIWQIWRSNYEYYFNVHLFTESIEHFFLRVIGVYIPGPEKNGSRETDHVLWVAGLKIVFPLAFPECPNEDEGLSFCRVSEQSLQNFKMNTPSSFSPQ